MMEGFGDKIRELYGEYLQKVEDYIGTLKPSDGLLGMGNGPQNAPCHDWFDEQVAGFTAQLPVEATPEVLQVILLAEEAFSAPPCAKWMLVAVQRHGLCLIPQLHEQDAASLLQRYTRLYSVFHRLPVQKEIVRALKKKANA